MRTQTVSRWLLTAVALIFSTGAAAQVRINEIHYDNIGVDTGEAIEIEGPADTDITAYTLVLYNGANGAVYNQRIVIGTLPASCGSRGVFVSELPHGSGFRTVRPTPSRSSTYLARWWTTSPMRASQSQSQALVSATSRQTSSRRRATPAHRSATRCN